MNRKRIILLLTVFLAVVAQAQPRPAGGMVYDFDGTPMVGVSVVVPGTQRGTVTDENGAWQLSAAPGETVQFYFIGYETLEEKVGPDGTVPPVTMAVLSNVLDDVIVVGYGAVKKSDLTGSVASVKMEAITDISATSVDGLLQGRAAGLQVVNSSQDPGAAATVRIRGNSSINGSNTPLVVVNGFPMGDAGALTQINTSDIASIEVLKDASASAIYGSRGANGVILVTRRSSAPSRTRWTSGTTPCSWRR